MIFLLLSCSVALRFEYGGEIRLRISYLCFTIVKYPAVKKKNRRRDKKAKKAVEAADSAAKKTASAENSAEGKNAADKQTSGAENKSAKSSDNSADGKPAKKSADDGKMSLGDIFETLKLLLDSLGKPLKKLLHRTRIYRLRINIVCGGEDAAKAALNFGRTNILVGNALGWLGSYFTLKTVEDIHIDVDFQSEETSAEASCLIKLSLFAALAFLFTLFGRAVRYYKAHPEAQTAVGKLRK